MLNEVKHLDEKAVMLISPFAANFSEILPFGQNDMVAALVIHRIPRPQLLTLKFELLT
jgi:hypothetical protein